MSESNPRSETSVQELIATYLAIVKRAGVESDEAKKFREQHPECPGLDDVDAAYSVPVAIPQPRLGRGCLVSLIVAFVIGIAALGVMFGSRVGLLGKQISEVRVTAMERVIQAETEAQSQATDAIIQIEQAAGEELEKISVELQEKQRLVKQSQGELKDTVEELATTSNALEATKGELNAAERALNSTSRQLDAAKNLKVEFENLANALSNLPDDVRSTSDSIDATVELELELPNAVTEPQAISLENSNSKSHLKVNGNVVNQIMIEEGQSSTKMELQVADLQSQEVRTVVVAASSGSVKPSAVTVIAEELTTEPKLVSLELLRPAPAPNGTIVSLRSNDSSVEFFVGDKRSQQVVVPAGQTAVRFAASSRTGPSDRLSRIIATVDSGSPFLVRALPETIAVPPSATLGAVSVSLNHASDGKSSVDVKVKLAAPLLKTGYAKVTTANPNVSFGTDSEDSTTIAIDADASEFKVAIATKPVDQPEVADIVIEHAGEQKHLAFMLLPRSTSVDRKPPFTSLQVPTTPVAVGETFSLSIPLAVPFDDESKSQVEVSAAGIRFSKPKVTGSQLVFDGLIEAANGLQMIPIKAEFNGHVVTSHVMARPPIVLPNLPAELKEVPATIVGDSGAIPVSIDLPQPVAGPAGVEFELTSSSSSVKFETAGEPLPKIKLVANPGQPIGFNLVAADVHQPEAVCITLKQGRHEVSRAVLVTPKLPLLPKSKASVKALVVPHQPVVSGNPLIASLQISGEPTAEELASVSLSADPDSVKFVRQEVADDSRKIEFTATAPEVSEPQLLRVTASLGPVNDVVKQTEAVLLLPKETATPASRSPSLVSISVMPQASGGEVKLVGEVKLDLSEVEHRQAVFLTSTASTVMVPEFIIIEPDDPTATFAVTVDGEPPTGEVRIVATLGSEVREHVFVIDPIVTDPAFQQAVTSHRCSRWSRRFRRR